MDANPIGVIVLGLAALGAAAYEVYEHWDQIKTLMSNVFTVIAGEAEALRDRIETAIGGGAGAPGSRPSSTRWKASPRVCGKASLPAGTICGAASRTGSAPAGEWIEAKLNALEGGRRGRVERHRLAAGIICGAASSTGSAPHWTGSKPGSSHFGDWFKSFLPSLPSWLGGASGWRPRAAHRARPGRWAITASAPKLARQLYQHATAAVNHGGLGLDRADALAMLGNAEAESGLNPAAIGPHGTSAGLFQEHNSPSDDRMTRMNGDEPRQLARSVQAVRLCLARTDEPRPRLVWRRRLSQGPHQFLGR